MKKNYLFAAVLLISGSSFSQNLTSSDIAYQVGDNFTYHLAAYTDPGTSGTGVTWDFSSMSSSSAVTAAVTANSGGTFPAADIKVTQSNGVVAYYVLNSSVMEIIGQEVPNITFTYSDGTEYLEFPITSSANFTDPSACTFSASGLNFSRTISSHTQFSGYGTLITPAGTFTNCVRLQTVQNIIDTYSGGTLNSTVTGYNWYKAGVHHEMANISTTSSASGTTQAAYYSDASANAGIENNTLSQLIMSPNPANAFVNISAEASIQSVTVYSLTGQEVMTVDVNGLNTTQLNIESLNAGIYMVKVLGVNGEMSVERLSKN